MKRVFLDTSYYIAVLHPADEFHDSALAWAQWIKAQQIIIHFHDGILVEIGNNLVRKGRMTLGASLMDSLLHDPNSIRHALSTTLVDRAMERQRAHADKLWSLVDCASFVLMRELDLSAALTADRHFEQAGFRALLREAPPSS